MDVICDIDGTLADLTHRRHWVANKPKNWKAFFATIEADKLIMPIAQTIDALMLGGARIILCSGRDETLRARTKKWLSDNLVYHDALYMRAAGDNRADDIIKSELLDRILADGYQPTLVFDDRQRVVDMWRRRGLICAQVAPGDF